jgi:hypothetical protein
MHSIVENTERRKDKMSYKNDLWKIKSKSDIQSVPTYESLFGEKGPELLGKYRQRMLQIVEESPDKETAYKQAKKETKVYSKELTKELIKKYPESKKNIEHYSRESSKSLDLKLRFYELKRIYKKRNLTPKEFKELKSIVSKLKKLK